LVIDDDPIITAVYSQLLRDLGFEVEVAEDGVQGFQSLRRSLPDVVMLDLDMPKMDGMKLLKKIRGRVKSRSLPVVLFTAGKVESQLRAARTSDAMFVLSKTAMHPRTVVDMVAAAATPGGIRLWT
jgi:CheY-like chemotaxis protein